MIKIIRSKDCGNSPKNKFVEELEIAFAKRDIEFLLNNVTDDIHWNIVGQKSVCGMDKLSEALKRSSRTSEVAEISIKHVVTHGKAGSVNGARRHKDGKTYDFLLSTNSVAPKAQTYERLLFTKLKGRNGAGAVSPKSEEPRESRWRASSCR